ncbi:hypothetical protein SAMN04487760_10542 [Lachnospiraceae bacterium G41]|nr:hypothetical protein SAMN04487760_10542 [Lachnospiraceae bacterium G41]
MKNKEKTKIWDLRKSKNEIIQVGEEKSILLLALIFVLSAIPVVALYYVNLEKEVVAPLFGYISVALAFVGAFVYDLKLYFFNEYKDFWGIVLLLLGTIFVLFNLPGILITLLILFICGLTVKNIDNFSRGMLILGIDWIIISVSFLAMTAKPDYLNGIFDHFEGKGYSFSDFFFISTGLLLFIIIAVLNRFMVNRIKGITSEEKEKIIHLVSYFMLVILIITYIADNIFNIAAPFSGELSTVLTIVSFLVLLFDKLKEWFNKPDEEKHKQEELNEYLNAEIQKQVRIESKKMKPSISSEIITINRKTHYYLEDGKWKKVKERETLKNRFYD